MMKKKNLAVIAVGNELMGDDGIGPAILNALFREPLPEGVDLIDGGTGGMSLLHIMKDYNRVIFIDSGDFGGAPGEIRVFTPRDVHSIKKMRRYSLHESDLIEIIHISQKIGEAPEIITIVVVQSGKIGINTSLSSEVINAVPRAVREVISQIKRMKVE